MKQYPWMIVPTISKLMSSKYKQITALSFFLNFFIFLDFYFFLIFIFTYFTLQYFAFKCNPS